jgi:hypothetical protein
LNEGEEKRVTQINVNNSLSELTAAMLTLGEPLKWDVYDMRKQLLLAKGTIIKTAAQLDMLLDRGLCVVTTELSIKKEVLPKNTFDPFWLWTDIRQQLGRLFVDYVEKRETDHLTLVGRMMGLISLIEDITKGDADVAIFELTQMDLTNYVAGHAMQMVFVCGLVARRMGLTDEQRHSLCKAAGTMNASTLELHAVLSTQKEALSPDQRRQISEHAAHAAAHLVARGATDKDWLQAVADHHLDFRSEGANAPSLLAQIIHGADLYLAKISPRSYRPAKSTAMAAREIMMDKSISPQIAAIIVKEMGIYPPGTYVKLANGDTAVVLRRGEKAQAPQVCSLTSGAGSAYIDPVRRDTGDAKFAVTGVIPRSKVMVTVNRAKIFDYKELQ